MQTFNPFYERSRESNRRDAIAVVLVLTTIAVAVGYELGELTTVTEFLSIAALFAFATAWYRWGLLNLACMFFRFGLTACVARKRQLLRRDRDMSESLTRILEGGKF